MYVSLTVFTQIHPSSIQLAPSSEHKTCCYPRPPLHSTQAGRESEKRNQKAGLEKTGRTWAWSLSEWCLRVALGYAPRSTLVVLNYAEHLCRAPQTQLPLHIFHFAQLICTGVLLPLASPVRFPAPAWLHESAKSARRMGGANMGVGAAGHAGRGKKDHVDKDTWCSPLSLPPAPVSNLSACLFARLWPGSETPAVLPRLSNCDHLLQVHNVNLVSTIEEATGIKLRHNEDDKEDKGKHGASKYDMRLAGIDNVVPLVLYNSCLACMWCVYIVAHVEARHGCG